MSVDWRLIWNIRKRKKTDSFFQRTGKKALPAKKKEEGIRPVPGAMLLPREKDFVLLTKRTPGNIGSAVAFMREMTEHLEKKIRSDSGTEEGVGRMLSVLLRNIGMQESGTVMKPPLL